MEHSRMREYLPPTLVRRECLAKVTAGDEPRITGPRGNPKGGCFKAAEPKRK